MMVSNIKTCPIALRVALFLKIVTLFVLLRPFDNNNYKNKVITILVKVITIKIMALLFHKMALQLHNKIIIEENKQTERNRSLKKKLPKILVIHMNNNFYLCNLQKLKTVTKNIN